MNSDASKSYINWYERGNQYLQAAQYADAVMCYANVVKLRPDFIAARNNMGLSLFKSGQYEKALQCFAETIHLAPDYIHAYINMGMVLERMGRIDRAKKCLQKALEIDSGAFEAHYNLGLLYEQEVELDSALECYLKALAINPGHAGLHINMGFVYHQQMRFEKGLEHFKRGFTLDPESLAAQSHYLLTLPILYQTKEEIAFHRRRYEHGLEIINSRTDLDTEGQRLRALELIQAFTPFYLQYQGKNDLDLQTRYGDFVHRVMGAVYPHWVQQVSMPDFANGDRIRIGYLSSYMHSHTVGKILIGWLRSHDRGRFEIHAYYIKPKVDSLTEEIRANCDVFHHIVGDLEKTAERILSDRLHLLTFTDIGMHPPATMLAALRLAPIQCKAWGHPVTTGLPTMDYYLSSDLMEPENGQEHYREKLVRLPHLALVSKQNNLPEKPKQRDEFGLAESAFVYLSTQSLFKYLPQYDEIYPRIAIDVDEAHFVFIAHSSTYVTEAFKARLKRAFERYGLEFELYCKVLPRMSKGDFLSLNACCDVLLDTIDWSGGNTTMEAIACGIPAVVTLPGAFMRGRHTYAMLKMMEFSDTIAASVDQYIEIAVKLGRDPDFFSRVQKQMAAKRHRIFNDDTCIRELENFYSHIVKSRLDSHL